MINDVEKPVHTEERRQAHCILEETEEREELTILKRR